MIPLGLYRCQDVDYNMFKEDIDNKKGANKASSYAQKDPSSKDKRKEVRYVVTHPPGRTILKSDDLVFVLA